jgi:hypothetical protein
VKQLAGGLGVLACGPTFPALACGLPGSDAWPTHPVWRDSAFTKVTMSLPNSFFFHLLMFDILPYYCN